MMWQISVITSAVIVILTVIFAVAAFRHKNKIKIGSPLTILFCGCFAAAFVIFLPICFAQKSGIRGFLISLLLTIFNTVKIFLVDGDVDSVISASLNLKGVWKNLYEILGVMLVTLSPLLTFSVVLSFFENILSYQRYLIHFSRKAYVFSELNEKSLTLAESIRNSKDPDEKKSLLIFTDVFAGDDEKSYELKEAADDLGSLCFKQDITSVNFKRHKRSSEIYFMVIGNDEAENISQALKLIDIYQDCSNVRMDVFAKTMEAEMLLNSKDKGKIQTIRRLNDVRSLVIRTLYDTGEEIFKHTVVREDKKIISAIVVGMGQHGLEMAKALTWFCQMSGYRFEMNIFDRDSDAAEKFEMECPDFMSKKYNGAEIDGEPFYDIHVHAGVDVNTSKFRELLEDIKEPTYVFVCLGSDTQNVKTSTMIRSFYALNAFQPRIQAVLYNSSEQDSLKNAKYNDSKRTQIYDIEFTGDIKSSYTSDVIISSEIEQIALERHKKWGSVDSFWAYDYNYRSSVASAIHQKMKELLEIPYAAAEVKARPEKERDALRKLEHCRWSAYVRSEGYTYGPERNDLAKKHPCLVPYEELSDEEKAKDDVEPLK